MKDNRAGKFSLSRDLIDRFPEKVKELMRDCIIIRAEYLFYDNHIQYIAISDYFEQVESEFEPPFYGIRVDENKNLSFGEKIKFY